MKVAVLLLQLGFSVLPEQDVVPEIMLPDHFDYIASASLLDECFLCLHCKYIFEPAIGNLKGNVI